MKEVGVMSLWCAGMNREMVVAAWVGSLTANDQKAESNIRGLLMNLLQPLRRFLANPYAILTMRWMLAGVFLLSSGGKLVNIARYSIAPVMEFGILPIPLAHFVGAVLPFVELMCALGLLFGVFTRLASCGIALMSITFFVVKGIVLWQGGDLMCGCFGAIVTTLASFTIYMDPPIFLMSLAVMLSPRSSRQWVSLRNRQTRKMGRKERAVESPKYFKAVVIVYSDRQNSQKCIWRLNVCRRIGFIRWSRKEISFYRPGCTMPSARSSRRERDLKPF